MGIIMRTYPNILFAIFEPARRQHQMSVSQRKLLHAPFDMPRLYSTLPEAHCRALRWVRWFASAARQGRACCLRVMKIVEETNTVVAGVSFDSLNQLYSVIKSYQIWHEVESWLANLIPIQWSWCFILLKGNRKAPEMCSRHTGLNEAWSRKPATASLMPCWCCRCRHGLPFEKR